MINPLTNILTGGVLPPNNTAHTTPNYIFKNKNTLSSPAVSTPESSVTTSALFSGGTATGGGAVDLYAKYRDPKTGNIMSPEEYALYLGKKVPNYPMGKGTGDIPQYAGDALLTRANQLNNARNDIATGTTDPYKAATKSGIAYNPAELRAIESAYAGVYDPALNDVFERLKIQETEAKSAADSKRRMEEQVFATNENIRQWRATTGTKSSSGGGDGSDLFTRSQLNDGASNSGLEIATFESLDNDVKNYFINTPKGTDPLTEKSVPMTQIFDSYLKQIEQGSISPDAVAEMIADSSLPEAVKHYYIDNLPLSSEQKESWISKIWGMVTGAIKALVN